MTRKLMIAAASVAVLAISTTAFAQQSGQYGTAAEAKTMLLKVVAAVKADKTKALAMFNKGETCVLVGFVVEPGLHVFQTDPEIIANLYNPPIFAPFKVSESESSVSANVP
jgi:hypothetical protein